MRSAAPAPEPDRRLNCVRHVARPCARSGRRAPSRTPAISSPATRHDRTPPPQARPEQAEPKQAEAHQQRAARRHGSRRRSAHPVDSGVQSEIAITASSPKPIAASGRAFEPQRHEQRGHQGRRHDDEADDRQGEQIGEQAVDGDAVEVKRGDRGWCTDRRSATSRQRGRAPLARGALPAGPIATAAPPPDRTSGVRAPAS